MTQRAFQGKGIPEVDLATLQEVISILDIVKDCGEKPLNEVQYDLVCRIRHKLDKVQYKAMTGREY